MKHIIAIVGMPGAGKSAAAAFCQNKQIPIIRFGDLTEETIREKGLPLNPENEKSVREDLRRELGMEAYAIKAKPRIEAALEKNPVVVLDGLYSWEEYVYLIKFFPQLKLLHVFANPQLRYSRLAKRLVRPLTIDEARARDIAEVENLHKGGPIAIADYLIKNEAGVDEFNEELEIFLNKIEK